MWSSSLCSRHSIFLCTDWCCQLGEGVSSVRFFNMMFHALILVPVANPPSKQKQLTNNLCFFSITVTDKICWRTSVGQQYVTIWCGSNCSQISKFVSFLERMLCWDKQVTSYFCQSGVFWFHEILRRVQFAGCLTLQHASNVQEYTFTFTPKMYEINVPFIL